MSKGRENVWTTQCRQGELTGCNDMCDILSKEFNVCRELATPAALCLAAFKGADS